MLSRQHRLRQKMDKGSVSPGRGRGRGRGRSEQEDWPGGANPAGAAVRYDQNSAAAAGSED
jgi:hypothetical protein